MKRNLEREQKNLLINNTCLKFVQKKRSFQNTWFPLSNEKDNLRCIIPKPGVSLIQTLKNGEDNIISSTPDFWRKRREKDHYSIKDDMIHSMPESYSLPRLR